MEHKTFTFEVKAVDYEGRTLEGYAAGIGNLDQGGDIIHPGAFRKTLIDRSGKIKFLWQHDPTEPIGTLLEAREESSGLFVKAIISETSRGKDAIALLKDGAISEMSIGYDAVKGSTDYSKTADGATVRNLREIKLYEFSLVTFPMNEAARVTALKENPSPDMVAMRAELRESLMGEGGRRLTDEEYEKAFKPSEGKPWANVPEEDWGKMEDCVNKVMETGKDKDAAIAICYSSIVGGKSLKDAFILNGFDYPDDEQADKGGDPISAVKVGRTISRATLAKLKAARDVIDELCNMGVLPEEDNLDTESKSATINSSIDIDGKQLTTEYAAGPNEQLANSKQSKPPTERMLKLIEFELSDLANH